MKKLMIKYALFRRKRLKRMLQGIADKLWGNLNKGGISKLEFDMLIAMGYRLNNYAVLRGIKLR